MEQAWTKFVEAHSGILLHTCRTVARSHDAAMDGYAYVLEKLREDGFRRLRGYTVRGNARFTTWLVVVTRRLMLDHHRQRYGRPRSDDDARRAEHVTRRRLEDLVVAEVDLSLLAISPDDPDFAIRRSELAEALRRSLDGLDPGDRLLLALRFEDDLPAREIAAVVGLPTAFHVYRRLNALLSSLKRDLARRGVVEAAP